MFVIIISLLFSFFSTQVRNRFTVRGKAARSGSQDRTNSRDTSGRTRARRSSRARCAIGGSCEATTWPNTPAATWPPRRSPTGKWRSASWAVWPPRTRAHNNPPCRWSSRNSYRGKIPLAHQKTWNLKWTVALPYNGQILFGYISTKFLQESYTCIDYDQTRAFGYEL